MNISKIRLVSQWILLIAIALMPILFAPLSWISSEPLKIFIVFIATIFLFISLVINRIKQNHFFVSKNILFISIGTLVLANLLSTIFSNNIFISLVGRQITGASFLGFITLLVLSYVVYDFLSDEKMKIKLFITLYITSIVVGAIHLLAIVVPFFPTFGFFLNNTSNTLGSWYDLGLYALFIALSSALVLQFLSHTKLYRILGRIGLGVGTLLMILVNSPMIFLIAIFFSLAYIIFNGVLQRDRDSSKRVSYEVLTIFIISIIFLLIGPKTGILTNSLFDIQANEVRPQFAVTMQVAGQVIQNQPILSKLFGVGLDRFDVAWFLYKPTGVNLSAYWDTDFKYGFSTIASYFVTQGVFGALAWIFFIIVSMYLALKLIFVSAKQKSDSFMYLYSAFGYIFFLTTMIFYTASFVLITLTFIFFGLLLSNLVHAQLITYNKIVINKNPRVSFIYILVLVLFLIGSVYVGYIYLSQYSSRVLFERATVEFSKEYNILKAETEIQKAIFIFNSDIYTRGLTDLGLLQINQIIQDKTLSQEQAMSQFTQVLRSTITSAQTAILYDRNSYVNRMSLIAVYKNLIPLGVNDAKQEAFKLIDETSVITPQNPTLALEKARIYVLAKEYDQAIEEIKKAIELKSNYVDAVFLLSQIQVEKGEIDKAVESIQAAIQVDMYNPNLRFQLGILYYNQQKFNDAIVFFEDAIKLSPSFANAKYFLGLSYYKNNRTSDAITVFENLNSQVPNNQEVQLILNNLKTGADPFSGAQPPLDDTPEDREELPLKDGEIKTETKNE